ncbi:tRNA (cytidine(32)/guanosine(34)-2'-O)-methyltransferase [Camellia lanceoleosa]|uniref:tRNA (Cytidine(32)/guanosine(34)-2'-O)-methyltransferase n=1 Tax=Camellia lanceoleosa TaxID=1840588 RepID=A0ACC0HQJ5_9ERIC|nr:tRNA (cytidine(32)/guanosine(34)-2'-O)-methyltransferase [Camellia lanceoleosa]
MDYLSLTNCSNGWLKGLNKVYIPFLASGDVSGCDLDRSYSLPRLAEGTYQSLDPIQPPIGPPYTRALEMKKASSHGIRDFEKLSLDLW